MNMQQQTGRNIREITEEELPLIRQMALEIWPPTYGTILSAEQVAYMLELIYSITSLQRQFREEQHHFLVVEMDGRPAGFADYSALAEPGVYKLNKIYVQPFTQGTGIGKALIAYIIDTLKTRQAKALQLNVNRYNKARHFYEKLGFRIIHEEDIDIGNNYFMNDYVMEKPL